MKKYIKTYHFDNKKIETSLKIKDLKKVQEDIESTLKDNKKYRIIVNDDNIIVINLKKVNFITIEKD